MAKIQRLQSIESIKWSKKEDSVGITLFDGNPEVSPTAIVYNGLLHLFFRQEQGYSLQWKRVGRDWKWSDTWTVKNNVQTSVGPAAAIWNSKLFLAYTDNTSDRNIHLVPFDDYNDDFIAPQGSPVPGDKLIRRPALTVHDNALYVFSGTADGSKTSFRCFKFPDITNLDKTQSWGSPLYADTVHSVAACSYLGRLYAGFRRASDGLLYLTWCETQDPWAIPVAIPGAVPAGPPSFFVDGPLLHIFYFDKQTRLQRIVYDGNAFSPPMVAYEGLDSTAIATSVYYADANQIFGLHQ